MTSLQGLVASNYLVTPGALNLFEKLLKNNSNIDILNQVIWLASHLGSESIICRDILLQSNIFTRIISVLQQNIVNTEILKHGCWLLGNLIRGKPTPSLSIVSIYIKQFLFL